VTIAGKETILKETLRCDVISHHARFQNTVQRPVSPRDGPRASTAPGGGAMNLKSFWDSGLMGVSTHERGNLRRSPSRRYSARFGTPPAGATSPRRAAGGRPVFATEQRCVGYPLCSLRPLLYCYALQYFRKFPLPTFWYAHSYLALQRCVPHRPAQCRWYIYITNGNACRPNARGRIPTGGIATTDRPQVRAAGM